MGQTEYRQILSRGVPAESYSRLWLVGTFEGDAETLLAPFGQFELSQVTACDLFQWDLISLPSAARERKITTVHRYRFTTPLELKYQFNDEHYGYSLQSVSTQTYAATGTGKPQDVATVVFFEFCVTVEQASPNTDETKVENWITATSRLLHIGDESIAGQLWKKIGTSPQRSYVITFLHFWGPPTELLEVGILDAAEALCAGLPGNVPFDSPMGKRMNDVPPRGIVSRSEGFYYFGSPRRLGCVLANDQAPITGKSDFRRDVFPRSYATEMLGVFGLAAVEDHFVSLYSNKIVELGSSSSRSEVITQLRNMNRSLLTLRIDVGGGQVSNRHGVQAWYDLAVQGLQLSDRVLRFQQSLTDLLEIRQAELQEQDTENQRKILEMQTKSQEREQQSQLVLTTLGLFVAGAFAYTTVVQTLLAGNADMNQPDSSTVPMWLQLYISESPWSVFVPMLFWGGTTVLIKQVVWYAAMRIRR